MNNDQFRKLALGSSASSGSKHGTSNNNSSAAPGAARALGSRQKASIPMTPRYGSDVSRVAFARQLAERYNNGGDDDDDKTKQKQKQKFRTSNPKGSTFAAGYVDRAKMRSEQGADDSDRAARLAALEALHRKGEVEQAKYEKLRFEMAGGDLSSTHLVKGLDVKLLSQVRMGEDVYGNGQDRGDEGDEGGERGDRQKDGPAFPPPGDVDDEFEQLEAADVQAVEREKAKKKGQYSTTAAAGQKRSRDQILAEMKAAREAAKHAKAAAAEPALSSRFKKIGAPQAAGSRIEIDSRGREVLVLVDEDGHEKRKVRKAAPPTGGTGNADAPGIKSAKGVKSDILGMDVPEFYRKKQEAEAAAAAAKEVDIFDDAGSDYDPLAGMDAESSDEDSEEEKHNQKDDSEEEEKHNKDRDMDRRDAKRRRRSSSASRRDDEVGDASDASEASRPSRDRPRRSPSRERERRQASQPTQPAAKPRSSYFGSAPLLSEESSRGGPSLKDPSVLAALRKAKQMREASEADAKSQALSKEAAREARLKTLMQSSDRDAEDLDMGFGTNRLEDTEDLDEDRAGGRRERLSTWHGGAGDNVNDDDDESGQGGGSRGDKAKRKRGGSGKKRKGDGNNAEDVMRVLEKRRAGG
ncbi:hypothetical protein HMPREF1624_08086 [Sporothrix schenckii ATCC 58251]|uniref:RED-like N-terminal domain-containing protein n=1 Tax=Sporothrix schenckii (strain ATCC 58251 / de Perez 2211183) TaxID=1391915 RepID=U7PM38_SPOS1|nr:hypothetical protein HMPREF1624_08086 [Sporothrix schenckii ATCC 58251]